MRVSLPDVTDRSGKIRYERNHTEEENHGENSHPTSLFLRRHILD
jgi:hypothetical protein